ncbi:DUF1801 domain-containing protein [Flavobacterium sp. NRK F10]|uniref:DUF1801 domain-containing protein n=1 Tax=Flavobacterium sp. NRK F10 TaxID=2954931 RepID=UPI002091E257|nr:DUF1801 domain-containing protein [Flavobacterium sp. NRK F10]MCO6176194.1 DUF1801 domain-containing protein [Flavobacterium sp. NRK F10]
MNIPAQSVEEYLEKAPADRKETLAMLRQVILDNLPENFKEEISYGMVGYVVPHEVYPNGYHCNPKLPLPFMSFASQKNSINFYHMGIYADKELSDWFLKEYAKFSAKKLDMGKSCMRFKKAEDIPFELIGKLVRKVSAQQWITTYEAAFKK